MYVETVPIEMRVDGLDLDRLRRGFAELFDRAAHAVQLAGHEQDDAVLERFLIVRSAGGADIVVRADWLADRERLVRQIGAGLEDRSRGPVDVSDVQIVGARVEAMLETGL
ncbi:MAG: hypothetical protein V1790_19700 [Planctomycetota bacterium]